VGRVARHGKLLTALILFIAGVVVGSAIEKYAHDYNVESRSKRDDEYIRSCNEAKAAVEELRARGKFNVPATLRVEFDTPGASYKLECENADKGACRMIGEERKSPTKKAH
jgi:hypothetical protein